MTDHRRNLIGPGATLREVMLRLNEGVGGVVLVVDAGERLLGVCTDGDVRRALLGGAAMDAPATDCMSTRFVAGSAANPREGNLALLSHTIRHVPVLDAEGRVVELLSWTGLWRLGIAGPSLTGNEMKYVCDCVASGWISSQGAYVQRFESAFADYIGAESITTTSGTTALHLALAALGIGAGDEVIVPNLTFGASANAVAHAGATPVLVDVTADTWTLDPAVAAAAITPRTRALMPVHLYGHPCDMDALGALAARHGLAIVEDCAESLAAEYRGRLVGTFGDVACFSFFANKIITTGEGGMLTARDPQVARRARILRDHGMTPGRRYWHEATGYNYRMTNLQAAIGLAQIERLPALAGHRRTLAARYAAGLAGLPGLRLAPQAPWAASIFWLYSVVVDPQVAPLTRDDLMARLAERGIETRRFFYPLHVQPAYGSGDAREHPVSVWLAANGLSLPTGNETTVEDVDRVCEAVHNAWADARLLREARGG